MTHRSERATRTANDLDRALLVVASIQDSIRHADTKIAAVVTLHGGLLTALLGFAPVWSGSVRWAAWSTVAVVTAAAGVASATACAARHLAAGFRPRIADAGAQNRFGFPSLAVADIPPAMSTDARCRDEAWRLAMALSSIAAAKHRHVRAALRWTLVSLAGTFAGTACLGAATIVS